MELLEHRLALSSRNGYCDLYGVGDIHLGSKACDEDKFREDIEKIRRNPYAYWVGIGDYLEAINYTDPRFDPKGLARWLENKELDNLAKAQAEKFIELVKPIKDKCLHLHTGNHEEVIRRRYHQDIVNYVCMVLNKPFAGYTAFSRLNINYRKMEHRTRVLILYSEHGSGGGELPGAKALKLQRQHGYKEADVYFYGHVHEKMDLDLVRLAVTHRGALKLLQKPSLGIICGSYLRSYPEGFTAYTEMKSVRPVA